MARDPELAQIHIAKKELGLDDDTYRDVLRRVLKVETSKGLSSPQKRQLIDEFKRMGWSGGSARKRSSKAYVRKIFALWGQLKRDGVWRDSKVGSLRAFVKKQTGCDDPDWLTFDQATVVIEALKDMEERQTCAT